MMAVTHTIIGKHDWAVDDLAFHEASNCLISVGRDGKVMAWKLETYQGKLLYQHQGEHAHDFYHRLAIYKDQLLVGATDENCIWINLADGNPINTQQVMTEGINDIAISPQGILAATGDSYPVHLWKESNEFFWSGECYKGAYSVDFSPSGKKMILGSWNGSLYEVDLTDLPESIPDLEDMDGWAELEELDVPILTYLVFKAKYIDENRIVYCGHNDGEDLPTGYVHLLDLKSLENLHTFYTEDGIHTLAVSSDQQYVAAGGNEQKVWLWRLPNFELVCEWELGTEPFPKCQSAHTRYEQKRYFPANHEFYDAAGPYTIHSLLFHPNEPTLFAGAHNGEILRLKF